MQKDCFLKKKKKSIIQKNIKKKILAATCSTALPYNVFSTNMNINREHHAHSKRIKPQRKFN